jgi:hypothetical protein
MQKLTAKRAAAFDRQHQVNGGRAAVSALLFELIGQHQKHREKDLAAASR